MLRITVLFFYTISMFTLVSCVKDEPEISPLGAYENGFFIANEGKYFAGNASITFVKNDWLYVEQNVFYHVNQTALGDVVQDIYLFDLYALIVVNNSNKLVISNRYTMKELAIISTGLNNPRYVVAKGNFAYISNWGDALNPTDDFIAVINLATKTLVQTIPLYSEGPEKMYITENDKLYIFMKGGWGYNNLVKVLNLNDGIITTLTVGDIPDSFVVKSDGIYVLCSGKPSWSANETAGSIYKINTSTQQTQSVINFDTDKHPQMLNVNGNFFYYYLNGNIYKWNGSNTLPTTYETGLSNYWYHFSIANGKLYALDAKDYNSNGELKIFDLTNNSLLKTIETGLIPNSVVFN